MVAFLLRFLGYRHLEVAEEIVQETLLRALQVWTAHGLPPAPEAWLMKAARNRAIDFLRSRKRTVSLESDPPAADETELDPTAIRDDVLRLMFSCCDPRLAAPDQLALTLHFVCGLSTREIAAALLVGEEAVRKRLFRARRQVGRRSSRGVSAVQRGLPIHRRRARGAVRSVRRGVETGDRTRRLASWTKTKDPRLDGPFVFPGGEVVV